MKRMPVIEFGAQVERPWSGMALLLIAAAVLGWQLWDLRDLQKRIEAQQADMQRLFVPAGASSQAMTPQDSRRHRQMEVVASYLAAPWDTLLTVFESHGQRGVTLRRLEPDASTGLVRMVGEARSLGAMMDYVLALEADKRLSQVMLLNHDILKDAAGAPVEFTLSAAWRPGMGAAARSAGGSNPAGRTEGAEPVADTSGGRP